MTELRAVRKRSKLLVLLFIAIGVIFVARAAEIQIFKHKTFKDYADSQQKSSMVLKSKRGSIFDCRGRLLAYDMDARTYTVNPRYMKDQNVEADKLARITRKSKSYWLRQFKQYPGFLYVARKVMQKDQPNFENSEIQTLKSRAETERVYPFKDLAADVLGRTDTDNHGVSGLERYYDDILSGTDGKSIFLRDAYGNEVTNWEHTLVEPVDGSDIHLALDLDLQQIMEDEIRGMLDSCGALYGTAVFMDLDKGGIVACGTVEKSNISFQRCRSVVDRNEPGSTAKLVPLAAVFQAGIFEPDDVINVEGGRFTLGRHSIRDDHPYDSLRCDEVGIYSSNIGVSKMGLAAGSDLIYSTLVRFGFGEKTGVDFPGEISGLIYKPEDWTEHFLANVCFGYGIAVTGLQITRAYGAVAHDGELLKPYFAVKAVSPDGDERILNTRKLERKILDQKTLAILNRIFLGVVQVGTAKKANNNTCTIAGKTGTALRTRKEGRGYDPKRSLASFVGYFPADAPRYAGIVMFDEPKTSIYGGEVSAPVFRNIARRYVSLPRNNFMARDADEINRDGTLMTQLSNGSGGENSNATIRYASAVEVFPGRDDRLTLPDFSGKTIRDAYQLAQSLGLKCEVYGSGLVEDQKPVAGVSMDKITKITLYGK